MSAVAKSTAYVQSGMRYAQKTELITMPTTTIATPSGCEKSLRRKSAVLGHNTQRRKSTRRAIQRRETNGPNVVGEMPIADRRVAATSHPLGAQTHMRSATATNTSNKSRLSGSSFIVGVLRYQ